ncbi:putative Protein cereblon [Hypsibius exemplaris]|uniref:Protein cereblon n=1 Tax=Hypsibius exemplaris TaxID=2072580 RepID=A0A1W0XE11_HYPEX|nr:putative Protein cereblon [Hypsibius exemplaris]
MASIPPPDEAMSDNGDEQQAEVRSAFFDVTLPAKHAYLGQDLREIHSTPFYAEGSLVTLPFVYVPDVVLMPNQQIPINVDAHDVDINVLINDMGDIENQRKGFVCMAADVGFDLSHVKDSHPYFLFGTVASVVKIEKQPTMPADVGIEGGTRMIVRGCQRCLLKDFVSRGPFHRQHGLFRILPENGLEPPLEIIMPNEWKSAVSLAKRGAQIAANLTPYSPALFATFDVVHLVAELRKEIMALQLKPEMDIDATDFSYWLSTTLPLPAHFRLQLLGAVSTVHRLRSCLMMLRTFNRLNCAVCGIGLAVKEDGICMNRGDLTAAYINPGGVTQEIFTMRKVSNISVFGAPTAEYTWFPGYTWRHLRCRGCHGHVGWKYESESPELVPKFFYGLRRGDVVPSIQPEEGMNPSELQEFFQVQNGAMQPVYYREK